jgi:hypothetical protein
MLRLITDGKINPEEAVRAYHGVLQGKGIKPQRRLEDDLRLTVLSLSYDGSVARRATVGPVATAEPAVAGGARSRAVAEHWPKLVDGTPDFGHMTSEQRLAYDQWRFKRRFG